MLIAWWNHLVVVGEEHSGCCIGKWGDSAAPVLQGDGYSFKFKFINWFLPAVSMWLSLKLVISDSEVTFDWKCLAALSKIFYKYFITYHEWIWPVSSRARDHPEYIMLNRLLFNNQASSIHQSDITINQPLFITISQHSITLIQNIRFFPKKCFSCKCVRIFVICCVHCSSIS